MTYNKTEVKELAEEMGMEYDETVHFLVDCGEIDSVEHEALLTAKERKRVYGE